MGMLSLLRNPLSLSASTFGSMSLTQFAPTPTPISSFAYNYAGVDFL